MNKKIMSTVALLVLTVLQLAASTGCAKKSERYTGGDFARRYSSPATERRVSEMKVGESGWTVPWAMYADKESRLWLNGEYTIHDAPGGTVQMRIVKTAKGYSADLSKAKNERWNPGNPCYASEFTPEPVCHLSVPSDTVVQGDQTLAILPKSLEEDTISKMKVGDSGWTVPWAMYADKESRLWLNGNYSIQDQPGGTVQMRIVKTAKGYSADISKAKDRRWNPSNPCYVGEFNSEPVCHLSVPCDTVVQGGQSLAILPKSLEESIISKMKVGESAWTVPWAMYADAQGRLWLNGQYSLRKDAGGTVQMLVTRTGDGYTVDVKGARDKRWSKGTPGYVGEFTPEAVSDVFGTSASVSKDATGRQALLPDSLVDYSH